VRRSSEYDAAMADRLIIDSRGIAHEPGRLRTEFADSSREPLNIVAARSAVLEMVISGVRTVAVAIGVFVLAVALGAPVVPFGLAIFVVLGVLTYRSLAQTHREESVRQLATGGSGARHCVCCAYNLHGLVPEADGCVVCPECGAAWRVAAPVESRRERRGNAPARLGLISYPENI
jgi:hypothetical protein